MATATAARTAEPYTFDRTVAELKEGVAYATKAQAGASEKAIKAAKDLAAFNRASLDAITAANKVLATGSMELFSQMAASSQAAIAEVLFGYRALANAKSLKEGLELQASQTRAAAERAISEGTRFVQASVALIEKASAPLTAHAAHAAEAFKALKV
jgi:hypothetical protein